MKNWEVKKLGEVYTFKNGINFDKTQKNGNGILTLDVLNMYCEGLKVNVENLYRIDKKVSDDCKLKNGDILIVRSSVKEEGVAWATYFEEGNEPITYCGFIIRGRPIEKLNSKYVVYFLRTFDVRNELIKKATKSTITNINQANLSEVEIPLPPLPEQQRIVAILDEAFAAIAKAKNNAEQNLQNAKELFESYLQGVFDADDSNNNGWEENCLDELGVITSSKRIYKSEYVKDGVPFYRTKEIKELSNRKDISLELFISRARYEEIKKSFGVPLIGDLLMSAVGTIGEIMVIENEDEFYFKDGNIVWFKGFENLDTNYLKYALTAFVEKIKSLAIGAAYSALTIEKLNKYRIAYPKSKIEQQTIVQKLDALSAETKKLESIYQQKIKDLEELKKSVLQKAFAGELKTEKAVAL